MTDNATTFAQLLARPATAAEQRFVTVMAWVYPVLLVLLGVLIYWILFGRNNKGGRDQ